ncbi:phage portal protein [Brevibacterium album]|uniref:phage portal protein n=1 Tax=Brevibacterium album TaxID=417948 RepID=UPI00040F0998|nr:phage portal protein [Brevibacterium album]
MDPTLRSDLDELFRTLAHEKVVTGLCDDYINGKQADPWSPDEFDQEYKELKDRAKTNIIRLPPLVVSEVSHVQGYRRTLSYDAEGNAVSDRFPEEFKDFRRLRFGNLQSVVHHASAAYGQSFVEVYKDSKGRPGANILSSLNTTALWDNPVSDEYPRSVLWLVRSTADDSPGLAYGWDRVNKYRLETDENNEWVVVEEGAHGFSDTPIVRFPCFLDSEGRVQGLVENLIEPQDRVNQSVLDLLTGQAYTGNQIYTASGVQGERVLDYDGTPKVDENGNELIRPFRISARRMLTTDNPEVKFDRIPAGSLEDLLAALGNSLELFAVAGQMSPYIFHGKISNLAAEALAALDSQFFRLVKYLQSNWSEGWASVFRLFAECRGDEEGAEAWDVEVRWADFSIKTFSSYADGLAKIAENLGIPREGLWHMVPEVSSSTIEHWRELKEKDLDYAEDADNPDEFDRQVDYSRRPRADAREA